MSALAESSFQTTSHCPNPSPNARPSHNPRPSPPHIKFPPTARDFEVYRQVAHGGKSTWQAASLFQVSQTRIRQILERVENWAMEFVPELTEAMSATQLRLAEHLASDRLEYHYGQAMEEWRATKQPRYLMQAMRVALAQAKVLSRAGVIDALAADLLEGPLEEYEARCQQAADERPEQSPPDGDFSENPAEDGEPNDAAAEQDDATPEQRELCELLRRAPEGALDGLSTATRSLLSRRAAGGVAELRIRPDQPGASILPATAPPERELSRSERRRMRKKLLKAKGLAG